MCGIIGYLGEKPVIPILLEGLKKLEYRGYDSAGIAVVGRNKINIRKVKGKISNLEESLDDKPLMGSYGIGHTRWATHGRPSEKNAHPHKDCTGSFVVVHNGIVENYLPIKKELIKEGHEFCTETDTEVIAHLIEKYYHGSLEKAVKEAVNDIEGAYTFAAISTEDKEKIIVAKMGPPAVIGIGDKEYFVSSDMNPLLSHTQDVIFLEDGEIATVKPDGIQFFDFEGKSLKKKIEHITWNPVMVEKKGYKHFMLKEIFEQPQAIRDTLEGRISLDSGEIYLQEMGIPSELLKKIKKIVIIACGTSYHAALIGKYFIEALAGISVDVEFASEYRYSDFILDQDSLVVVISQSGETADTLAALREAKKKTPFSLAICNVAKSSIARSSKEVIYTHAGPEIGVAATKTFSAQIATLALIALYLAQSRRRIDENMARPYIEELIRIPNKMEKILSQAKSIEKLAKNFLTFSHFLYLGRWVSFPVALEGALKLKEISYVHAEGYPGGEMKHGPIALIDEHMPTIAVIPKDKVYDKILSNISEIKARSGYVLALAFEGDRKIPGKVDEVISIPVTNALFSPFLSVLPLQLFAYYMATLRGADVDQPRNLAKSVTVE